MKARQTSGSGIADAGEQKTQTQWAQDFPVDVGRDNYVARRDFTKFMVLTSFAFVVGQLWIAMENARRRWRGQPPVQAIGRVSEIPVGSTTSFKYPGEHDPCLLIRRGADQFVAYGQKCTHLSCAVIPQIEAGQFFCPCHEGCFDMNDGRPVAGPPRRPLPRVTLQVRGGMVFATGVKVSPT